MTLRQIAFLLLSLTSGEFYGQCFNPFKASNDIWGSVELDMSDAQKQSIIDEFGQPDQVKSGMLKPESYLKSIHPIYIDSDTLVDFIYHGWSGGESEFVDIMLNKGNKLESIHSEMGKILNVSRLGLSSGLNIQFLQYGCCDDPNNYIETWVVSENSDFTSAVVMDRTHYLQGTEIPDCFDTSFKFKVLNTPYTLRATPEINNEENAIHNFEKGNIIAEYGVGDIGTALASRTDETGRIWWFVIMETPLRNDLFHNYKYYRSKRWVGWISSRYLAKIN
ncbi:hypothetical protein [Fulvivirga sp.]|uniref:hypothetical protein n=1 Tax=Fulvivirga sp. TaxID=1931237 RepID=UPI0032EBD647